MLIYLYWWYGEQKEDFFFKCAAKKVRQVKSEVLFLGSARTFFPNFQNQNMRCIYKNHKHLREISNMHIETNLRIPFGICWVKATLNLYFNITWARVNQN